MRKHHQLMVGLFMLLTLTATAQNRSISGKITDAAGTPIPNASIRVKGSSSGSSADMSGSFHLSVGKNASLVITAIGYESKEIKIGSSDVIDIQLNTDSKSLSEVVVTGLGVATSKKKVAFAIESVSSDKLPPTPTASIDQALVGKIAGAQISSVNGTPGAPASIVLRGINTIQGGTKPLILLDGVEVYSTDLNSLDLTSIDRIEVVQGAASSTMYGAQGANGVIQLFSKKGKKGQMRIDITSNASVDQYINAGNFHKAMKHGFKTDASGNVLGDGGIAEQDEYGLYQGVNWAYTAGTFPSAQANPLNMYNKSYDHNLKYYDHFRQLFGNGHSLNNSILISGAGDKSDYSLGISNATQSSSIRKNGKVSRTNVTSNLGIELFKGFKLRSITQLVYTNNTLHPYYGFGSNNIFNVMNVSPFYDLNKTLPNTDGLYPFSYYPDNGAISVNGYNPNFDFANTRSRDHKVDIIQNLQATWNLNHFVDLEAKYGINYNQDDINWLFYNQSDNPNVEYEATWQSYNNGTDETGEIDNFAYKTVFQNFLASAYFKTDFKKDFHINLPITTSTQFSYDYRKRRYSEYFTYGYSLPSYAIYNMQQTSDQRVTRDYVEPFVTYGFLLNQKVDFGEYGGISGGFRTDYSSAFGQGSKPFTFPRGDAYLRVSSFGFWQNSSINDRIPELKLRGAYGKAGVQPQPFDRYRTLTPSNIGDALIFRLPTAQTNPNLQVEVSREFEVGTDINIKGGNSPWFSNFVVSATYWTRKGQNEIYNVSVAPSTGANTSKQNAIFLSGHGIQASLNMTGFSSRDFTWDFTVNFSKQTSKVDRIIGGDIILTTSAGNSSLVLKGGQTIGQIYGYKAFTSVFQKRLDGTPYLDQSNYGKYQMVKGMLVDTATKAIQFTNDKYPLGDGNPKFNMSFINSFTFKNFLTLGFQFDWIYGTHLYNQTKEWMYRDGIHSDYDGPVTINGQTAAYTAFYRSAYAAFFGDLNGAARNGTKDYFMEGASFLRLRNVSLGFDLARAFKIPRFNKLQLVLTGRNVWTVTNYSGFDPEINSASGAFSAWDRGIDHNSMPNVKSWQVGLNLGL